jgi:hypothetical protein
VRDLHRYPIWADEITTCLRVISAQIGAEAPDRMDKACLSAAIERIELSDRLVCVKSGKLVVKGHLRLFLSGVGSFISTVARSGVAEREQASIPARPNLSGNGKLQNSDCVEAFGTVEELLTAWREDGNDPSHATLQQVIVWTPARQPRWRSIA